MPPPNAPGPSSGALYEIAAAQSGYVTTKQAADAGYSTHLLRKHIQAGRVIRLRRGIYRLVHFPAGEHEELVSVWLWSEQTGLLSHQTRAVAAWSVGRAAGADPPHAPRGLEGAPLPRTAGRGVAPCGLRARGSHVVLCGSDYERASHPERLRSRWPVARATAAGGAAGSPPRSRLEGGTR